MKRIKLTFDDIEPLGRALIKYVSMGSGLIFYKGEGWYCRMARYALEDLKAKRLRWERD